MNLTPSQRELAEETLQLLTDFLGELSGLGIRMAARIAAGDPIEVTRLVDGLELVFESTGQIGAALELHGPSPSHELEKDLLALLEELIKALDADDRNAQVDLLGSRLPAQLGRWRDVGMPAYRDLIVRESPASV